MSNENELLAALKAIRNAARKNRVDPDAIYEIANGAIRTAAFSPPPEPAYRPQVIHYDGEGDQYWQFVERDVATVTGQVFAANVETLMDFDGNIIGFNVYEPAPSSPVPVEAVTIKPLEWSEHYRGADLRGGETVIAKTILGRYQVWGDGAWTNPHEFHNPGAERGLDVGKAAAQAHFDAAVRSALHREVGE